MRNYLDLGDGPAEESSPQLGSSDYYEKVQKWCRAYINQIRRQFGKEPGSARLCIKSNPHDFGTYYSVICRFDDQDQTAVDYAFNIDREVPENWDEEAVRELSTKGVDL